MSVPTTNQEVAALYGIAHSNRNFQERFYWGKNQFNSSFPVALCCYMRDKGIDALGIELKPDLTTSVSKMSFDMVFGTKLKNEDIFFRFESDFSPFKPLVADSLEKIDVVILNNKTREEIRPLEIKLTTLPDDGTSDFPEEKYGSEIVVRSPTMRYVALSMAASNKKNLKAIKTIFDPVCKKIDNWENVAEMKSHRAAMFDALKTFLKKFCKTQKPLLVQPIWKTIGKNPELADHCLDVFVWTDFAITRLILDSLDDEDDVGISRPQRAALRLSRFLYEISRGDSVYQKPIYDGMTFGLEESDDDYISVKTVSIIKSVRVRTPMIGQKEITNIIIGHPEYPVGICSDLYDFVAA